MIPKNNRTIRGTHYFPEMHTPGQIIDITDEHPGELTPGYEPRDCGGVSKEASCMMAVACSIGSVLIIAALLSLFL